MKANDHPTNICIGIDPTPLAGASALTGRIVIGSGFALVIFILRSGPDCLSGLDAPKLARLAQAGWMQPSWLAPAAYIVQVTQ